MSSHVSLLSQRFAGSLGGVGFALDTQRFAPAARGGEARQQPAHRHRPVTAAGAAAVVAATAGTARQAGSSRAPTEQPMSEVLGSSRRSGRGAGLTTAAAAGTAGSASGQAVVTPTGRPGDEYFTTADSRPIILFDGVCNMCNGGVNFMLDWDREGVYRFAALQSDAGRRLLQRCGRSPDDISSIVLVEAAGGSYTKASAVLRIAQRLRAPLPLVAAALDVLPGLLKDGVYDQIAANRYSIFGRASSCRLGDSRFDDRFVSA